MTLIIEVILTFFYSFPILHIFVGYIDDIFLTSVTHTLIFPLLIIILSIFHPELNQSAHSYNQWNTRSLLFMEMCREWVQ